MIRCTRGMGTPPISCFLPSWVGVGGTTFHEDVIKWKRFLRYWSFVRGIHRSPVNSSQRPVTQRFDAVLNKRLSRRWWCQTPSHSLWRHCNFMNSHIDWFCFYFRFIFVYLFKRLYTSLYICVLPRHPAGDLHTSGQTWPEWRFSNM